MFLDESGEASMKSDDPNFNIFVLCGVLFSEIAYNEFDNKFKALKHKFFGTDNIIFHSIKMRKPKGVFKILLDETTRNNFYNDINQIFVESNYQIISCVINKSAYKERYPHKNTAYQEALKFMCERSMFCLRREDVVKKLIICLEQRGKEDALIKKYYTQFIKHGTSFMSRYEMRMCAEKLIFRPKSANVNGLQLADLIAYPIARKHLTPDSPQPTYEVFFEKFYKSNAGECKGYGLKVYP